MGGSVRLDEEKQLDEEGTVKKIDLHIHTVSTVSDRAFTYSLDSFKRYVAETKLDAVAVTNHDLFNADQFNEIQRALSIPVFPGIEISVDQGHLLVITKPTDLQDFEAKTALIENKIKKQGDSVSLDEFIGIFGDLHNYLLIPHYDKGPSISGATLEKLRPYIAAGEVDSAKKFVRNVKDKNKLTPVLFSDSRMRVDMASLPTRHTFVDCGSLTLEALKSCLQDKSKVALSAKDGNRLWQVFDDGQMLSTGLNIVLGTRSTGKTHTLNQISSMIKGVKYIRQFSLVQQDEAGEFKSKIETERSAFVDRYLGGLKRVLDEVTKVDLLAFDRGVTAYLESLLKSADDADRRDAFSKAALFDEVEFPIEDVKKLKELIGSVRHLIENREYRQTIESHVDIDALKRLALELIDLLRAKILDADKKKIVNELVKETREGLALRTSAVQVKDVNLYDMAMDQKRVQRFREIIGFLKQEVVIFQETLQGFRVEAKKHPFSGAGEVKAASGTKLPFSNAFRKYEDPYGYLLDLMKIDGLPSGDYYKLFTKVSYRVLNKDGNEVSGGERSEFRLLQEISDAQNFDLLLIDEPESSFDNLFLKGGVNQILKAIAETMPVVVVTHNNTVGASVGADYVLFTTKELEDGKARYRIHSGYPTDKKLMSVDGDSIDSHETWLNSLEAGVDAYEKRRQGYAAVKG